LALSVTVTVKVGAAWVEGVPLMTPLVVFKLSPVGSEPADSFHV